ncbi:MAG: hypothetical protein AAF938_08940 [Myxococcota bacterium]
MRVAQGLTSAIAFADCNDAAASQLDLCAEALCYFDFAEQFGR